MRRGPNGSMLIDVSVTRKELINKYKGHYRKLPQYIDNYTTNINKIMFLK